MNVDAIRTLIQNDPRPTNAFSSDVRRAVGRYAEQRRREGAGWSQIANAVGVSSTSVRKWALAREGQGFHQVVLVEDTPVVEARPAEDLVITSPLGFTLTGCSLEQAIAVLRRLA